MAITRARTSSVAQGPSTKKTLLGGNDVILGGSYDAIGTAVVGSGGQSTITFSSIPGTYKHLQLRAIARDTGTTYGTGLQIQLRMNSDTASNYAYHVIRGQGASVVASATASANSMYVSYYPGSASSNTEKYGVSVIDILDYANTNKYKTVRCLSGDDLNGSGTVAFTSGLWLSTNAITSILLLPNDVSFAQYSQFDLYGIK
jgi:hypothetical protein